MLERSHLKPKSKTVKQFCCVIGGFSNTGDGLVEGWYGVVVRYTRGRWFLRIIPAQIRFSDIGWGLVQKFHCATESVRFK